MDNDENLNEYGPMVSAEDDITPDISDITVLRQMVEDLQAQKTVMEEDFGLKRKKFIDLYKQKETEANLLKTELDEMKGKYDRVAIEMDDIKTATAVSENQRMDEVAEVTRKYKEETASFEQVLREAVNEAMTSANEKFHEKIADLQQTKDNLEKEVRRLQSKLTEEREGFLASVAKTLQKKVTGPGSSSEAQSLEDSMRKAQEDSDMLKSVVVPLEEEINLLKTRLAQTRDRLMKHEDVEDLSEMLQHHYSDELTEQVRDLQQNLEAEKQARADLEKHIEIMKEQYRLSQKTHAEVNAVEDGKLVEKSPDTNSLTDEFELSPVDGEKAIRENAVKVKSHQRACEECLQYETKVKDLKHIEKENLAQLRNLDRQLELERNSVKTQADYISQLEASVKGQTEGMLVEIASLVGKIERSEHVLEDAIATQSHREESVNQNVERLKEGREDVQKHLQVIQEENDTLMGKYQLNSQALNEEVIDLPDSVEELQVLLLKKCEDLLQVTVGKEHMEQTLRSELAFVKAQLTGEQQVRQNLEESLSSELSQLQGQLEASQKFSAEVTKRAEEYRNNISDLKTTLFSLETDIAKRETELQDEIAQLRHNIEEKNNTLKKLDSFVKDLRLRNQTLQNDLENSEAVQRDFVKLSQSLQVQLEKIRSAENEVRWQHDDDVQNCNHCRQSLQKKEHCRHCGQIFCSDCLSKTVASGPNHKPAQVCDVCHTILVKDATPFFSSFATM